MGPIHPVWGHVLVSYEISNPSKHVPKIVLKILKFCLLSLVGPIHPVWGHVLVSYKLVVEEMSTIMRPHS